MPQKRKRAEQDPADSDSQSASISTSALKLKPKPTSSDPQTKPTVARRATRQTPVLPPASSARTETAVPPPSIPTLLSSSPNTTSPDQKRNRAPITRSRPSKAQSSTAAQDQAQSQSQISPPVLRWAPLEQPGPAKRPPSATMTAVPPPRPTTAGRPLSDLVAPEITYHVPHSHTNSLQRPSALVRPRLVFDDSISLPYLAVISTYDPLGA